MAPKLTAELFTIPLCDEYMPEDRYLFYAPLRQAATYAESNCRTTASKESSSYYILPRLSRGMSEQLVISFAANEREGHIWRLSSEE